MRLSRTHTYVNVSVERNISLYGLLKKEFGSIFYRHQQTIPGANLPCLRVAYDFIFAFLND